MKQYFVRSEKAGHGLVQTIYPIEDNRNLVRVPFSLEELSARAHELIGSEKRRHAIAVDNHHSKIICSEANWTLRQWNTYEFGGD
jgi:hypothetical protein